MNKIAFLDIETTGVDKDKDKIVSICIIATGGDEGEITFNELINPGIEIPKQATDVHGISGQMVKDAPLFKQIATKILDFIQGYDLAGFNSNRFDFPILYREFYDCGITWDYKKHNFIDVSNIYVIKEPRTLAAAYEFYTGQILEDAHNAKADIMATIEIFQKQQRLYQDLPTDTKELALYSNFGRPLLDISGKFSYDEEGDIIFNFGKHKGKKAADERSYLSWMLEPKAKFFPDTKAIAQELFMKRIK